jgi:hypothetical protein
MADPAHINFVDEIEDFTAEPSGANARVIKTIDMASYKGTNWGNTGRRAVLTLYLNMAWLNGSATNRSEFHVVSAYRVNAAGTITVTAIGSIPGTPSGKITFAANGTALEISIDSDDSSVTLKGAIHGTIAEKDNA